MKRNYLLEFFVETGGGIQDLEEVEKKRRRVFRSLEAAERWLECNTWVDRITSCIGARILCREGKWIYAAYKYPRNVTHCWKEREPIAMQ